MKIVPLAAFSAALLSAPLAWAQDPTFTYADDKTKQEAAEAKEVEWKVLALGGLVLTTGNAEIISLSGSAKASRKQSGNKFQAEAGGTYVHSTVRKVGTPDDGMLEEVTTTNRLIFGKARYDRFLTPQNSLYVTASYLSDEAAAKEHVVGGQLGYSRVLFANAKQELISEVGYDFSYEVPTVGDGVSIHSARVFVGYAVKLNDVTSADASGEALFNVNEVAIDGRAEPAGAFEDTRLNGKIGLSTKLFENISFRFGVEARYDNAPNFLDSQALEKHDIKAEASIIVALL